MRHLSTLILLTLFMPALAWAIPSPSEIGLAVSSGNLMSAESMAKEVLAAKPDSAKGHYLLGEIYNLERNYSGAYKELSRAAELDKSLSFASTPGKFQDEMRKAEVNTGHAVGPKTTSSPEPSHAGEYLLILFVISGLISAAVYLFMLMGKRRDDKIQELAKTAKRVDQSKDIQRMLDWADNIRVKISLSSLKDTTKLTRNKLLSGIKDELSGYLTSNKKDGELIAYMTLNSLQASLRMLEDSMDSETLEAVPKAESPLAGTTSTRSSTRKPAPANTPKPSSYSRSSVQSGPVTMPQTATNPNVTVNTQSSGSGSSGLVEGMILGEMLNGGHQNNTTVIERGSSYEPQPSYKEPDSAPSYDPGSSDDIDTGSSSSGFDSGSSDSSFDSGSSDSFDTGSGDSSSSSDW